jgi:DNA-binding response OmpR family regulator
MSPSPGIRHSSPQVSILVVDDDPGTRETAGLVLRSLNFDVHEAASGAAASAAIRSHRFDLALIDFHLPDLSGLGIIVELKRHRISVPWLLMSGWMTTPVAVEAMKLGAVDVVDVPFDIERVVTSALGALSQRVAAEWPRVPPASLLRSPRSAAERWACFVLRGCEADHDLKTIADWAAVAGVSYSALTENCRLVGIRPHDARDFLRVLRALFHQKGQLKDFEHRLDVNDHRTMKTLLARASLTGTRDGAISLRAFIDGQQFVDPECEAVRLMINMIAEADGSSEPGHTATTFS